MTVGAACAHFGVTDKTIRRWIKTGRIDARKNGRGQWAILLPDNDQTNDQSTDVASNDRLIDQLRDENEHLRQQVDRLTSLLAVTTQQNSALTDKLPPPRPSMITRIKSLFPASVPS